MLKRILTYLLISMRWRCYNVSVMAKRPKDFEEQFRQAILTCGMSRYKLSQLTGVAEAVLSNFVNGHRSLTLTTAAKLAKALNLELKSRKKGR